MKNKKIKYLLILVCLFLPIRTWGQADEESRSWNQPVAPYRVIDNVYYVGAKEVSSFLITTPAGHILLDSGFYETVPQIQRNVAQLGFRLADIKFLLNSHAHYDHAGGLALLKELTKAPLLASEADAELLARGGKNDPNFGDRFLYPPVKTDRVVRDGDTVELGGVTLVAHLTPGHTKGCTTWTMKAIESGKPYNVVFMGSTSAPGYKLVGNAKYPTIVADYERTFRSLKTLPCDVFLAAHGSSFAMLEKMKLLTAGAKLNPFINSAECRTYLTKSESTFREELKRQEEAARR